MNDKNTPAPSLYQYLDATLKANVSHLAIGVDRQPDGGIHFYIHPAHISGETEDYLLWPDPFEENADLMGNRKNLPMPDVKGFLEKLRADQLKDAHAEPATPPASALAAADAFFAEVMLDQSEEDRIRPALLRHFAPGLQGGGTATVAPTKADPTSLLTSAERLHEAIAVMLKDWKDGDFELPRYAEIHMENIREKHQDVGKALRFGDEAFAEFQKELSPLPPPPQNEAARGFNGARAEYARLKATVEKERHPFLPRNVRDAVERSLNEHFGCPHQPMPKLTDRLCTALAPYLTTQGNCRKCGRGSALCACLAPDFAPYLREAGSDTARMDWLQSNHDWLICAETDPSGTFSSGSNQNFQNWATKVKTVRQAIDAAMHHGKTP